MKTIETAILNEEQIAAVNALMQKVHQFDKSFRDPYLDNQYNFFPEMPAFILGYENGILIGLTVLYADEDPSELVDIYVNVLPEFRRKGYGLLLRDRGLEILQEYGYKNFEYISEMRFLEQNPDFLKRTKLKINPESEYQMYYSNTDKTDLSNVKENLKIKRLHKEDIPEIAKLSAAAFESDLDHVIRTLEVGLSDEATQNFVLTKDNHKIGFGKVDISEQYYYIYNLLIDEDYRNQGFGTAFVKMIVNDFLQIGITNFKIGVDIDNVPAVKAYQNAGFIIETEVVYLVNNDETD